MSRRLRIVISCFVGIALFDIALHLVAGTDLAPPIDLMLISFITAWVIDDE